MHRDPMQRHQWRRMSDVGLLEQAQRRTRLSDFGEWPFREGLQRLLDACANEADLSLFGYFGTRWDIGRLLSNLLRLRSEELRHPAIPNEAVERPIFITGLPRSGTTFLHRLLALDSGNRVPRVWETIYPYPDLNPRGGGDPRQRRVDRQLCIFSLLSPEFRRMHPIDADTPQECSEITAHVFASLRFDTTYRIPSYRDWLDATGHINPYRFHKRFLQHLQHQAGIGVRWVLKCPDHVFALDAIRSVYPDARLVFVHRDPLRVLPSIARLTEVLRRPFTRHVDRAALEVQEVERWEQGAELMVRAADEQPFAQAIFHIRHRDLVSNPLAAVEALYEHFGLVFDRDTAARFAHFVAKNPNGGYGANDYRLDTFGIDADLVRARFARYMAHFGIVPERHADKDHHSSIPINDAGRTRPDGLALPTR
jgi:hypothetical protein